MSFSRLSCHRRCPKKGGAGKDGSNRFAIMIGCYVLEGVAKRGERLRGVEISYRSIGLRASYLNLEAEAVMVTMSENEHLE